MPVFDSVVFDSSIFDALFGVPALFKVTLEREYKKITPGQAVSFSIKITDDSSTPGHKTLFNTATMPQVQIYNPDHSIKVAFTNMINSGVGVYRYDYQTLINDAKGTYTAAFKAINGDKTMLTLPVALYEVY